MVADVLFIYFIIASTFLWKCFSCYILHIWCLFYWFLCFFSTMLFVWFSDLANLFHSICNGAHQSNKILWFLYILQIFYAAESWNLRKYSSSISWRFAVRIYNLFALLKLCGRICNTDFCLLENFSLKNNLVAIVWQ